MNNYKTAGFSLLELLIVLSVSLILVSLAGVSYKTYAVLASRQAAQAYLLNLTTREEGVVEHTLANLPYQFLIEQTVPEFVFVLIPINSQQGDGALSIDYEGERKHFDSDLPVGNYKDW